MLWDRTTTALKGDCITNEGRICEFVVCRSSEGRGIVIGPAHSSSHTKVRGERECSSRGGPSCGAGGPQVPSTQPPPSQRQRNAGLLSLILDYSPWGPEEAARTTTRWSHSILPRMACHQKGKGARSALGGPTAAPAKATRQARSRWAL